MVDISEERERCADYAKCSDDKMKDGRRERNIKDRRSVKWSELRNKMT